MEEAELVSSLVVPFEAVLGGDLEIERTQTVGEISPRVIAPLLLKPAEHDDFDPEHRVRAHRRPETVAAKGQPVAALRQVQVRAVQKAAGRLGAIEAHRAVGPPLSDRAFFEPAQNVPTQQPPTCPLHGGPRAGIAQRQIGNHQPNRSLPFRRLGA